MGFSKQIGHILAETLEEIFLAEDLGLSLTEIRDPDRLRTEINHLSASEPEVSRDKINRLQALHDRKISSIKHELESHGTTTKKQHAIAKSFGYDKVGKGEYVHKKTGHTLHLNNDDSWSHKKSGAKRSKKGTPIQDLKRHLASVHNEEFEPLDEIRRAEVLRAEIGKLSQRTDPIDKQRLMRLQALQKRNMIAARTPEVAPVQRRPQAPQQQESEANQPWTHPYSKAAHFKGVQLAANQGGYLSKADLQSHTKLPKNTSNVLHQHLRRQGHINSAL